MIRDYIILGTSVMMRPFLYFFVRNFNGVIHIAYIKLGGLSKFVNDLSSITGYNVIMKIKGRDIIFIHGIPFYIRSGNYEFLSHKNILYHVHQLSNDLRKDWAFLMDKNYIITLHDYYFICERFFLLDHDFNYCNLDGRCCSSTNRKIWMSCILINAKTVIVPDSSMVDIVKKYFDVIPEVIPHGI